ncbi:MAG: hypothetical protein ACJARD_000165 [Alphaproteobacteria bacterium]|jgi:hypothetical protein
MSNLNQKGSAVLKNNQHKKQESNASLCKLDQSKSSVELLNDKLKSMGTDVGGIVISALQNLSDPFKEHAKMPIPLRNVQNGEFVGFITGNIIFDF